MTDQPIEYSTLYEPCVEAWLQNLRRQLKWFEQTQPCLSPQQQDILTKMHEELDQLMAYGGMKL